MSIEDRTGRHDHVVADCPVCQETLQPSDAGAVVRTWPVVNMPGLDPWLRHIEDDDDAPEPVSAFLQWSLGLAS